MASKKMGALVEEPSKASQQEQDWQAEDHARALTKAGEVLSDPNKMKMAMKHIKKQKKAMKSVEDLKAHYQSKYGPQGQDASDEMDGE